MEKIKAFAALRPQADLIADMIAPPYDVIDRAGAKKFAAAKPYNFLHLSKPEIDLPEDVKNDAAEVYQQAADNLQQFIEAGVLQQDDAPGFYIYRMTHGTHQQTGIFVAVASEVNASDWLRRHEFTTVNKEDDRLRHLQSMGRHISPVLLSHRPQTDLAALLNQRCASETPIYDINDHVAIRHQLWVINTPAVVSQIHNYLNNLDALYVADGHHRTAAANRYRLENNKPEDYFLAALFPSDQLQLLGYHRLLKDLNGLSSDAFITALAENFIIEAIDTVELPESKQHYVLCLPEQNYRLQVKPEAITGSSFAEGLDGNIILNLLLKPILAIEDPRRDPRISFCGGQDVLNTISECLNKQQAAAALLCPPASLEDIFTISDQGGVLPPKSTWFEPKLADGLVCL